jgi:acetate kinase
MVNFKSGLLVVSEISSDMRDLLEHETQDVRAAEAVALFCYQQKWVRRIRGGTRRTRYADVRWRHRGEHTHSPRPDLQRLGLLGIELEEERNPANAGVISPAANQVAVRVFRTDEERMIAKTVCCVLGLG